MSRKVCVATAASIPTAAAIATAAATAIATAASAAAAVTASAILAAAAVAELSAEAATFSQLLFVFAPRCSDEPPYRRRGALCHTRCVSMIPDILDCDRLCMLYS